MNTTLREQVVKYLKRAHELEIEGLTLLDYLISATNHEATLAVFLQHRTETERHLRLLSVRLQDFGILPAAKERPPFKTRNRSTRDQSPQLETAMADATEAYVAEHREIAAYGLLEQLALRLGDRETAHIARTICHDEEKMAEWIAANWQQFLSLPLVDSGVVTESEVSLQT
jgi:ferritin-like metal-binding protein YciE